MRIIFASTNILHTSPTVLSLSYGILHIIISYALIPSLLILPQKNKPDDEQPLVSNLDLECKSAGRVHRYKDA